MNKPDPAVNSPSEPDPVESSAAPYLVEDAGVEDARAEEGASADTTVYVRSRRTPTLAFWVVLSLVVPAVVALLVAPFLGVGDLGGFFNLAMVAVLAIGAPLAALACVVDMVLERRRAREARDSRKGR